MTKQGEDETLYVGKTRQSLNVRLHAHLTDAMEGNYQHGKVKSWIRSVDYKVAIHPVHENIDGAEKANFYERHYIAQYKQQGCNLLNYGRGGCQVKVYQFDLSGNLITTFATVSEAAKSGYPTNSSPNLLSLRWKYKEFKWLTTEDLYTIDTIEQIEPDSMLLTGRKTGQQILVEGVAVPQQTEKNIPKLMEKASTYGVVIGRFQVDKLDNHPGYIAMLSEVERRSEKVLVILGEAATVSKRNPQRFYHREAMFRERFPEFEVVQLNDEEYDEDWNNNLNAIIAERTGGDAILYGSRDSFIHYYRTQSGFYPTEYLNNPALEAHCATSIREFIKNSQESNPDIRRGIIHGRLSQYDGAFSTVDILITRNNGREVLLGQKAKDISKGVWRMPGGFIDKGDGLACKAAARELNEEANLTVNPRQLNPVIALEITNDWRYRSTTDTIVTNLYTMEINDQTAVGGDDLPNVGWFTITEAGKLMSPVHHELWQEFLFYQKLKARQTYAEQTSGSRVVGTIVVNPDNGKLVGVSPGAHNASYELSVYVTEAMLAHLNEFATYPVAPTEIEAIA